MDKMYFPISRGVLLRLSVFCLLVFLFFETYQYLNIMKDKRCKIPERNIRDYEEVLCSFQKFNNKVEQTSTECPNKGIVTTVKYGTLATVMWQYTNVLSASNITGLNGYIPGCMKDTLEGVFNNINLPLLSEIGHCPISLPDSVGTVEDWVNAKQSIVIRGEDLFGEPVMKSLDDARKHFQFTAPKKYIAKKHLQAAKPNGTHNVTYIGVYITETNVIVNQEYDDQYPNVQFFIDAMRRFREEYPNAVFVVITDRKTFWEYVFGTKNVYYIDEETLTDSGSSLAILAHCDHTILSTNDFAMWAAILTGGKAIVSLSLSEEFNFLMRHQTSWNYHVNTSKSGYKVLEDSL